MTHHRSIVVIMACLIASCAPKADKPEASAHKGLSERLEQSNGYTQDAKGNWAPKIDKRSSYENQGKSAYFDRKYEGKSFNADRYAKKSWWGGKEMPHKAYQGKMEQIDHQDANIDGKQSVIRSRPYKTTSYDQTGSYATQAATENDADDLEKPSDAETDVRRRTAIKPKITDYDQQRAMSIEQSKSLLGK